ncbi:hypothetical protein [Bythopirellula polymerisocia]|uniref:Uncharacterized protein n=1 Tax=Bythopirellula polymerisocia TaxID=2528003 RepID=A0A5C6CEE8_9BACT|nr:hypothetical protein [Bythopirellula polymerisocia]TWU21884.1 hypothetical protein Pla144_43180 [Bythopirellula polymerisocia]
MAEKPYSDTELVESLAEFEKQLETPVVPGELYDWAERGQTELEGLQKKYAAHIASSHEAQYKEIVKQDPGQIPRMERVRDEDAAILKEIERLSGVFARTKRIINAAEEAPQRDSEEIDAILPPLTGETLALIIRIRMQENAIDTWYVEAFQRDRGVAD